MQTQLLSYQDWSPPTLAAQFALRQVKPRRRELDRCAIGMILLHHGLSTKHEGYLALLATGDYPQSWLAGLSSGFDGWPLLRPGDTLRQDGIKLGEAVWDLLHRHQEVACEPQETQSPQAAGRLPSVQAL